MTRNGLSLNHTKTKCMLIHSPRSQTPTLDITLHGHVIEQVKKFKFLGVVVNDTLTWDDHINHIVSKISHNINLLRCISWFLPSSLLVLYLKSYVLPLLNYCDTVTFGHGMVVLRKILTDSNVSTMVAGSVPCTRNMATLPQPCVRK